MQNLIYNIFQEHQKVVSESIDILSDDIKNIAEIIIKCLKNGNKIILCGNGGSAADAQHIATEFTVRFQKNRDAFNAIAITTDSSALTAIVNDFGAEYIFSRQIEAIGNSGDILIAITTSGNSKNILKAVDIANQKNIYTISFTGNNGGKIKDLANKNLIVPSNITARIQEIHILIGHIICNILDEEINILS